MSASIEPQPIEYHPYTADDGEEMACLLGEVFARRDPPAYAVGLTAAEFETFVNLFCPKAAVEGLTVVARHADSGAMIGAMLTEDSSSDMPDGMECLSPKFDPIFDILGQLDAEYRETRNPGPGESIHLLLLGVADSALGQGIAQQLVAAAIENGVRKGYRRAVTEATNPISQHIFRKLGFIKRVHRSYRDYRFSGQAVFASIAEQGGPILMDRSLSHGT
jgi:GNAT superfamily N-acetyltransferase